MIRLNVILIKFALSPCIFLLGREYTHYVGITRIHFSNASNAVRYVWIILVRFIQGSGKTHAILFFIIIIFTFRHVFLFLFSLCCDELNLTVNMFVLASTSADHSGRFMGSVQSLEGREQSCSR